jgi:hypothetical protein
MVEKVDETLSGDDTGLDGSGELGERLCLHNKRRRKCERVWCRR